PPPSTTLFRSLEGRSHVQGVTNLIKALNAGILKVMSKMGISCLSSYCGAQIFEAIGLDREFVDRYFTSTSSRIGGAGIAVIAEDRKSTRLNSSHVKISYAVFCLK